MLQAVIIRKHYFIAPILHTPQTLSSSEDPIYSMTVPTTPHSIVSFHIIHQLL